MEGKWMYNLNGSDIWMGEEFDTKKEAIEAGIKETTSRFFEVGQIESVSVSGVDVDFILENVVQNTTHEVGELGEDYLQDVTEEQYRELEEKLNDVLFEWIEKHGYQPTFFKIENVEVIHV